MLTFFDSYCTCISASSLATEYAEVMDTRVETQLSSSSNTGGRRSRSKGEREGEGEGEGEEEGEGEGEGEGGDGGVCEMELGASGVADDFSALPATESLGKIPNSRDPSRELVSNPCDDLSATSQSCPEHDPLPSAVQNDVAMGKGRSKVKTGMKWRKQQDKQKE